MLLFTTCVASYVTPTIRLAAARSAPPVALLDLGPSLLGAITSSLPPLPASFDAFEALLTTSVADVERFASDEFSSLSSLSPETLGGLVAGFADLTKQAPSADLLPLLEAKQAELLKQLEQVEGLIAQSQPPRVAIDFAALRARDYVGPFATAVGLAATGTLDWRGRAKVPPAPYPTGRYDPVTAAQHYAAQPWAVLCRLVESGVPASGFGFALLFDWLRGPATLEANARVRAEQLVTALTAMGPTYIKVGQALSIRADLLPPAYITALTGLQDRVPAFESDLAKAIMADEWQLRDGSAAAVNDLFTSISEPPLAAASLGEMSEPLVESASSPSTSTSIVWPLSEPSSGVANGWHGGSERICSPASAPRLLLRPTTTHLTTTNGVSSARSQARRERKERRQHGLPAAQKSSSASSTSRIDERSQSCALFRASSRACFSCGDDAVGLRCFAAE